MKGTHTEPTITYQLFEPVDVGLRFMDPRERRPLHEFTMQGTALISAWTTNLNGHRVKVSGEHLTPPSQARLRLLAGEIRKEQKQRKQAWL